jgi:PadR family transcriptional regulator PadR
VAKTDQARTDKAKTDQVLSASTLSLLILEALAAEPLHGYGVARWIEGVTDDALRVEEGSLYPALHRLEREDLIEGAWAKTDSGRRARFYRLTRAGRRRLAAEREGWRRLTDAMAKVVGAGGDA